MKAQTLIYKISTGVLICLTLLLSTVAYANVAGKIIFASGDASITRADNSVHKAAKDAALSAGDTIETKAGRVQLTLVDGGKVSLQPNSIYKINKYAYSGKEDGSEYAFTELIKGGLRTISGAVGHKNRDRYQLKTAVATIGIRGTEFTVNFNDNNLLMTTNQGSVEVCSGVDCLIADAGMSIGVSGAGAKPKFSNKTATSQAAPPSSNKPVFAVADVIGDSATGLPALVTDALDAQNEADKAALNNYNGKAIVGTLMKTDCGCGIDNTFAANLLTDSGAQPTNISDTANGSTVNLSSSAGYKYDQFSDGSIAIGRVWDSAGGFVGNVSNGPYSGSIKWADYMVGAVPAPSQLNNLTGTYNVIASTAPIRVDNSTDISTLAGSANTTTGSLTFSFLTGAYNYNLTVNTTGETYYLAGSGGSLNKNDPRFATSGTITSSGSMCTVSTCTPAISGVNLVQGAFFGKKGERAGMQYGFYAGSGSIWGSTALK